MCKCPGIPSGVRCYHLSKAPFDFVNARPPKFAAAKFGEESVKTHHCQYNEIRERNKETKNLRHHISP